MNWTTEPVIEYEVFMAACPVPTWIPRLRVSQTDAMLGDRYSTLWAYKREDGEVGFWSHHEAEIGTVRREIEEHFGVKIVEYEWNVSTWTVRRAVCLVSPLLCNMPLTTGRFNCTSSGERRWA